MTQPAAPLDAVIVGPAQATAAVIWLHGLGADGHDFEPIVDELNFAAKKQTRFIFPHATHRPVTINNGYVMRAWYDIIALDKTAADDEIGIRESARQITALITQQTMAGIASERIILAGFSQGGAIALHTGLRHPQSLAGILALSTYLPLTAQLDQERHCSNQQVPIFMAHGLYDNVVPLALAEASCQLLQTHGYPLNWHTYPMQHSVCPEEINDVSDWFSHVLG